MQWLAKAPSNIALIKYMGKKDGLINIPANASLSYTLNHLESVVTLQPILDTTDQWLPLESIEAHVLRYSPQYNHGKLLQLNLPAQKRFLSHLHFLKNQFKYTGSFLVKSANNFPFGCGLASSASSFAALTRCAVSALCDLTGAALPSITQQAYLSQQGSGSSCRSFLDGFVIWENQTIRSLSLPYQNLIHQIIVIDHQEKSISSSEAHRRVVTSPLYAQRSKRANDRLDHLIAALNQQDWSLAYQICFEEFHDMHQLFASSSPAFRYIGPRTEQALSWIENFWKIQKDGPIVTLDAGPNIHLLYRADQHDMATYFQTHYLNEQYDVL